MAGKAPDQATTGDTVRLVRGWQDGSGIPLFAFAEGTMLTVVCPDMTTLGVVVRHEEEDITFSLPPDAYEVMEAT